MQSVTEGSKKSMDSNSNADEDGIIDRKTQSRATTNNQKDDPEKVWTTEEILADEDLWRVTDSSGSSSEPEEEEIKQPIVDEKAQLAQPTPAAEAEAEAEGFSASALQSKQQDS